MDEDEISLGSDLVPNVYKGAGGGFRRMAGPPLLAAVTSGGPSCRVAGISFSLAGRSFLLADDFFFSAIPLFPVSATAISSSATAVFCLFSFFPFVSLGSSHFNLFFAHAKHALPPACA